MEGNWFVRPPVAKLLGPMPTYQSDLARSDAEVRTAVMLAGKRIVRLNFGPAQRSRAPDSFSVFAGFTVGSPNNRTSAFGFDSTGLAGRGRDEWSFCGVRSACGAGCALAASNRFNPGVDGGLRAARRTI